VHTCDSYSSESLCLVAITNKTNMVEQSATATNVAEVEQPANVVIVPKPWWKRPFVWVMVVAIIVTILSIVISNINNAAQAKTATDAQAKTATDAQAKLIADAQAKLIADNAANVAAGAGVLVDVFTASNGLTNGSLVTCSSDQPGNPAYSMFNGKYGIDLVNEYYGWNVESTTVSQPLTIDGYVQSGHYSIVQISSIVPSSVVTAFELWSSVYRKPLQFYIIGSNDKVTWTTLYDSEGVNRLTTIVASPTFAANKFHTGTIRLSNASHYAYVGLFVLSSFTGDNLHPIGGASCQELRLFL
jgi:hypothetical protein